jgi:hypothetical protein
VTVIYATTADVLPGPYASSPPREPFTDVMEFYRTAPFTSPLTKHEAERILRHRVVLHGTYSLQQSDFGRMGFEVAESPWKVLLPADSLVVCIATRDRYDIFGTSVIVHQFESVSEWREGRDAALEGWE